MIAVDVRMMAKAFETRCSLNVGIDGRAGVPESP